MNENYFWRYHKAIHIFLTFNHYCILIALFTLLIMLLTLIQNSALIIIGLSSLMLIYLVIMRPYGKVSEKLRAIYFGLILIIVSVIRYLNN
jgi:hypothetical protein